jgi:hypothetical protein
LNHYSSLSDTYHPSEMGKGAGAAWVEQGGGGERDGILRGGRLGFHGDGEEARPEAATGEGGPTTSKLGRRSATACRRGNYGECATGGGSSRRRSDGHESWLNLRQHDLGKRRGCRRLATDGSIPLWADSVCGVWIRRPCAFSLCCAPPLLAAPVRPLDPWRRASVAGERES